MYVLSEIVDRIKTIADKRGIKTTIMLEELGLSKNTLSNMEKSKINCVALAKIADYLDCTTDSLLGRTSKVQQLSENEKEIINLFSKLSTEEQLKLIGRAELLVEQSFSKADVS